jgi:hypothetical protein
MYGKINTAALNIRSGPGTTFPIIGGLQLGDIVTASEIVNGWWHITDAERGGVNVKLTSGATVEGSPACWAGGTYILPIDAPPAPAQDSVTIVINQGGVVKTYKITGTIQLS